MVATSLGELRADVGGRRDAGNNQQWRSAASGRVEPALLAARTGGVLLARLPLCVAGFMARSGGGSQESGLSGPSVAGTERLRRKCTGFAASSQAEFSQKWAFAVKRGRSRRRAPYCEVCPIQDAEVESVPRAPTLHRPVEKGPTQ